MSMTQQSAPAAAHSSLNDLARFTRWSVALSMLPVGGIVGSIIVGSLVGFDGPVLVAFLVIELLFVLGFLGSMIWSTVWTRREGRALNERVQTGAAELAADPQRAVLVPGRVVRSRLARQCRPSYLGRTAESGPLPPMVTVFTVLLPGSGARRVAAMVPSKLAKNAPAVLGLHPADADVAILDCRVGAEQLSSVTQDRRWQTDALPTDRSVVGGWGRVGLAAVVGLVVTSALAGAIVGVVAAVS